MGDFMMEVWVFHEEILVPSGGHGARASGYCPDQGIGGCTIYYLSSLLGVFYKYDDCLEKSYEA